MRKSPPFFAGRPRPDSMGFFSSITSQLPFCLCRIPWGTTLFASLNFCKITNVWWIFHPRVRCTVFYSIFTPPTPQPSRGPLCLILLVFFPVFHTFPSCLFSSRRNIFIRSFFSVPDPPHSVVVIVFYVLPLLEFYCMTLFFLCFVIFLNAFPIRVLRLSTPLFFFWSLVTIPTQTLFPKPG